MDRPPEDDPAEHSVMVLRPLPNEVPAPIRMRNLLKIAGRQLFLRCESVGPSLLVEELERLRAERMELIIENERLRRRLARTDRKRGALSGV